MGQIDSRILFTPSLTPPRGEEGWQYLGQGRWMKGEWGAQQKQCYPRGLNQICYLRDVFEYGRIQWQYPVDKSPVEEKLEGKIDSPSVEKGDVCETNDRSQDRTRRKIEKLTAHLASGKAGKDGKVKQGLMKREIKRLEQSSLRC